MQIAIFRETDCKKFFAGFLKAKVILRVNSLSKIILDFFLTFGRKVSDNNVNCENHTKSDILHSDSQVKKKNHSHQIVHCVL